MSGTYGNLEDNDFNPKAISKKISPKREKPLRKFMEDRLLEEGEYQGFNNYEDLNRYCDERDEQLAKDEEESGEVDDLKNIPGVSYAVRW